ncbi:TetR/AcrR family transcriptional regulator [Prescottella subtropica]|uniref:TetR/AcrR family transcriptional regulator n=1 Tax=Prescottella subtropica TaxID=2545757 RepID=UPI0010F674C3|nr:TetR/AcrR family transcriptional regulator [Prescottella subtropica]
MAAPPDRLTLDAIVDAATALADERGTAAVPLRAVGDRLGCTAMALYTYVTGKDDLLAVMFDAAHDGLAAPPPMSVTEWAGRLLDRYVAHPWMLDLVHGRPGVGPHQQAVLDALLAILLPGGLDRRDVAAIASAVFTLTAAAARTTVDSPGLADAARDNLYRAVDLLLRGAAPTAEN